MNSKKPEVKRYKAIQLAFRKDCENLLRQYSQRRTFSYNTFAEIWRSLRFTLVFLGKSTNDEIRHFTQIFLFESKKHFCFAKDIYIRTGALYLMYGIYYKQPIIGLVQIRVTQDEFFKILDFINEMKVYEQIEPPYVYCKMMMDDAFDFVYTQQVLAPDLRHFRENFIMEDNTFTKEPDQSIEDSLTELLQNKDIALINSQYQKALLEYKEENKEANLMVFKNNILEDLKEIKNKRVEEVEKDENDKSTSIGTKRSVIKQKAMENKTSS